MPTLRLVTINWDGTKTSPFTRIISFGGWFWFKSFIFVGFLINPRKELQELIRLLDNLYTWAEQDSAGRKVPTELDLTWRERETTERPKVIPLVFESPTPTNATYLQLLCGCWSRKINLSFSEAVNVSYSKFQPRSELEYLIDNILNYFFNLNWEILWN